MKKIEAKTLEEAYEIACREFGCSISELRYEVVQYPAAGFLGLLSRSAIIVAAAPESRTDSTKNSTVFMGGKINEKERPGKHKVSSDKPFAEKAAARGKNFSRGKNISEDRVLESFFGDNNTVAGNMAGSKPVVHPDADPVLQKEIENMLKELIGQSCFDIDTVEVDVIGDTAYIFLDGEDAALIIGKEGYRYNAFSYLIFNWLHNRYNLYVKLEIAQFLSTQEEMIRNYIQPVIAHVMREGWGRTRSLDGILVQIALEQLREEFPDKYVAIKQHRDGSRYVLINEFSRR